MSSVLHVLLCSCAKILLKMHISNKINLKTKFGALITFACGVVCWRGCVFHACECPRCVCRASTRCLKKWQPPTFLLCLSPEIHHVTSWSTCSAHILPEKAFQVWLPWSGCIVCLLHNLSAGKMPLTHTHTNTRCFQLCAHTWGCLSSRINVSAGRFLCGLRRRESDYDGFARFLNWAMCK